MRDERCVEVPTSGGDERAEELISVMYISNFQLLDRPFWQKRFCESHDACDRAMGHESRRSGSSDYL